ncbi:MAG: transposase, partial [Candidatus Omnitrophota bacterium]
SSAISEGFNNKIKRLKRMAYGYRDIEYFKLKIHQHCGYLNPRRFSH